MLIEEASLPERFRGASGRHTPLLSAGSSLPPRVGIRQQTPEKDGLCGAGSWGQSLAGEQEMTVRWESWNRSGGWFGLVWFGFSSVMSSEVPWGTGLKVSGQEAVPVPR